MKILRDLCALLILDSILPYSYFIVVPRKSKRGFTLLCVK